MSLTPIGQKAHDIAHASFRVAALIKNVELKGSIESAAVALVAGYETIGNPLLPFTTPNVVEKLECLVTLAESIGEIKPVNAAVLKRELGNLQTAIDFHMNTFKGNPNGNENNVDITSMFAPAIKDVKIERLKNLKSEGATRNAGFVSQLPKNEIASPALRDRNDSNNGDDGISVRQMAILRQIRENQFCRLRNIVDAMPNISERTIRNDIQALIGNGHVRRIGGGGPNSYFETTPTSVPSMAESR